MDKIGLRFMKLVSVGMVVAGTLMFAFLNGDTIPLIYIAGILVALGSVSSLCCNHNISSMFGKYRSFCISLLSGAYDSCSVIPFLISQTYTTFTLRNSFLILAIAALIVGLFVALFLLTTKTVDMVKFDPDFKSNEESFEEPKNDKQIVSCYVMSNNN